MVFSSCTFLFFFLPITLTLYFISPKGLRNTVLLAASLFFYFWGEPSFLWVMLLSIAVNYLFGLWIHSAKERSLRAVCRASVCLSVIANLGLLFYYKYLNFAVESINLIAGTDIALHTIVLPIGISFFTFQGMSYVLDVYFGKAKVQKNPVHVALYISLFPQLIAGPIVRYSDIAEQLVMRTHSVEKFAAGIRRFTVGLSKKVIIANTMGRGADAIFGLPNAQNTTTAAWLGAIFYFFQIYYDFSGYSDMAIGLGKMFGFEFLENFSYPYISKSITEFWKRWHISMSQWFRDYLYIPLGGNRTGNVYVNLSIVFLATGIWHGASVNFILWGMLHGAFILLERIMKKREADIKLPGFLKWGFTMLIVLFGWVIFRADTMRYAIGYMGNMLGLIGHDSVGFTAGYYLDTYTVFILVAASVGAVPILSKIRSGLGCLSQKLRRDISEPLADLGAAALLAVCVLYVMTSTYNPFIYFRF